MLDRLIQQLTLRPYLTASLVFTVAAFSFFMIEPTRDDCQLELDNFKVRFNEDLFQQQVKSLTLPAKLRGAINNCYQINQAGGCFHAFQLFERLLTDLEHRQSCLTVIAQEPAVGGVLNAGLKLKVELAWGALQGPEVGQFLSENSWLETADIARFCRMQRQYQRYLGIESLKLKQAEHLAELVGEAPIWEEEQCVNCEYRKKAVKVLGESETKKRSLYGINCERF